MGRTVTLTARVRDTAGNVTTSTRTLSVPTLVGVDAPTGTEWTTAMSTFPGVGYWRDFGVDGSDTDTLPELPNMTVGKFATAPAWSIPHLSWKDDVEQLGGWLDGLNRPIYLTWYHEPMGDVTPATYRTTAARVTQFLANHPKRKLVLGHGPIVTRYWLDEGGGNPADWAYPGMTHYGIDCYQDTPTAASYWQVSKMFGVAFGKVRAAYPGIRLWVPEYGITRLTSDTTGAGRAQAIRDQTTWLKQQPDVDGVAYFHNQAQFLKFALTDVPSQQAWRDMQTT
ncbi:glycosyl hydrolase [Micromonospora aurantiaca]|uniref:glycosyl hydrolase n=1 Tax=Micromonospora aurantiaca (nom. illeg.) TaxID=47850 RepID=UPI001F0879D0|nr:glycosyl hydrolase [Micromonospora aurantiaca]